MAQSTTNVNRTPGGSHPSGASTLFRMSWEAVAKELDLPPEFFNDPSYHYILWRKVVLGRIREQIGNMVSMDDFLKRLASIPSQDELLYLGNGSLGPELYIYDHDLGRIQRTVRLATKSDISVHIHVSSVVWHDIKGRAVQGSDGRRISEGGTTCHIPFRIQEMISSQLLLHNITLAFGMPPDLDPQSHSSAWRVEIVFTDNSRLNMRDSSGVATASYYGSAENSSQAILLLDHLLTMNAHQPWLRNIGPSCKKRGIRLHNAGSVTKEHLLVIDKLQTSPIEELTSHEMKEAIQMYKSFLAQQKKVSMLLSQMPPLDRAVLLMSFSALCSCQKNRKHGVSGHIRTLIRGNLRDSFEHCDSDLSGFNLEETDGMVRWDTNDFDWYQGDWSFANGNHLWLNGPVDQACSSQLTTFKWPYPDGGKYHLGSLISAHLLFYRLLILFKLGNPIHRKRPGFVWEVNLKSKSAERGYLRLNSDAGHPRATFLGTERASNQALQCLGYLTSMYCLEGR